MVTSADAALWLLPFVTPIAIWAAWSDMKYMLIPNKAVMALVGVYAIVGFFVFPFEEWAWRWTHLFVILVIGFILNIIGIFGAGDAKFAAAMAPFIALQDWVSFMIIMGILIPVSLLTHRAAAKIPFILRRTEGWVSWARTSDFPFGLPLAAAIVTYLVVALR